MTHKLAAPIMLKLAASLLPASLLVALSALPALAAGGPVQLHLSAERRTETKDAQGHPKTAWAALDPKIAVHPGDVLRYDVSAENTGAAPVSGLVITQPVPAGTVYVARSAENAKGIVPIYSLDGRQFSAQPMRTETGPDGGSRIVPAAPDSYTALRWRFPALPPHAALNAAYLVKVR